MRRWSIKILVALLALSAFLYVADWVVLQIREGRGSAHGLVLIDTAEVIKEKGGKVEYFYNPPQPTPCIRALFPHQGQSACWWLARHSEQQQYMN